MSEAPEESRICEQCGRDLRGLDPRFLITLKQINQAYYTEESVFCGLACLRKWLESHMENDCCREARAEQNRAASIILAEGRSDSFWDKLVVAAARAKRCRECGKPLDKEDG